MSQTKAQLVSGTTAQDLTVDNINTTSINSGQLSNRNKIINGAMVVAQRGTSFTVSDAFTLDRYKFKIAGGGAATITQSSTTPDDFSYSYKVDVTTADTSVANTDHGVIMHVVEGYNFAPANFGSSAAKTCTLSFYVRSNKTGTYGVAFQNAAQNRSLIKEYTINSADTWERKTITISPDTTGSWNTTNGVGLKITWGLMGGSTYATADVGNYKSSNLFLTSNQVNLFDNTSNEWYMTGVQVEIGSTATDFEHRSFAQELALCQRYCQVLGGNTSQELFMTAYGNGSGTATGFYQAPVDFRSTPSFSISNLSHVNIYNFTNSGNLGSPSSMSLITAMSAKHWIYIDSPVSSTTSGGGIMVRANSTTDARFTLSAEL